MYPDQGGSKDSGLRWLTGFGGCFGKDSQNCRGNAIKKPGFSQEAGLQKDGLRANQKHPSCRL